MKHFDPFPLGHFKIDWLKFGDAVFKMREANSLTQRQAAELLGMSYPTICRVERGKPCGANHFFTLCQFVGIPFDLPENILQ